MIIDLCCLPYCPSREKLNKNGDRVGDTLSMEPPQDSEATVEDGEKRIREISGLM